MDKLNVKVFVMDGTEIMGQILEEDDKFVYMKYPFGVSAFIEICYNSTDNVLKIRQNAITAEYEPSESLMKVYNAYFENGSILTEVFDKVADKYVSRARKIREKGQTVSKLHSEVNPNEKDDDLNIVNFKEYFQKNMKDNE